ncbi:PIN domain-containing protein, partial [Reichenbachiella sp.]
MAKKGSEKKIFVLDTSVILFSHDSIMNFAEHDIGIPITVLEELDNFKKGNDTINFEAREFARLLDGLAKDHMLQDWIPLNGNTRGKFKVLMHSDVEPKYDAEKVFGDRKNDHKILNATLRLKKEEKGRKVILVSKDINLRLKAKSLEILAEDYETGKIKDASELVTGKYEINKVPATTIDTLYKKGEVDPKKISKDYEFHSNGYYILKSPKNSALSFYNPITEKIGHVEKKTVYNIKPRNAEQAFAIHSMMNPDVRLAAITGMAGTGKTLLALACALEQKREFKQIYLARPIVPLSNKDIGYLPGDIKS